MSKQIEINGLKLTVGKKVGHEGFQPSRWDDVRHSLVDENGNPDRSIKIEGFEKLSDASACASRMRKIWKLPIKSYTDIKSGLFGITYKPEGEAEDEEVEAPQEVDQAEPHTEEQPTLPIVD